MARILIAGCGDVGATLGQSLGATGHKVWGLIRQPRSLPSAIRPVIADLTDPASLADLPARLDYIVYSAAASGFDEASYQAAYVTGVSHLLDALRRTGQQPKRLLFTSSTSVYAQHQGERVDEDSPAEADGFSGRCLREGEQLMWNSGCGGSTKPRRTVAMSPSRIVRPPATSETSSTSASDRNAPETRSARFSSPVFITPEGCTTFCAAIAWKIWP